MTSYKKVAQSSFLLLPIWHVEAKKTTTKNQVRKKKKKNNTVKHFSFFLSFFFTFSIKIYA